MGRSKKAVVLLLASLVLGGLIVTGALAASDYPTKPITVLQGFKPGGGSDALATLTQPFLEKILGKSFVNQYIPGATGAIAWTQLSKSTRPDGYTVSITNTPMLMTNYIMNPEITYNINELTPIANVVTDPGIIVVGKDSPYKTIQEFLAAVKKSPGMITVGNSGIGGDDFFTTLIFEKASGLKFQMVPFQGDGPSWQAAMGERSTQASTTSGSRSRRSRPATCAPWRSSPRNAIRTSRTFPRRRNSVTTSSPAPRAATAPRRGFPPRPAMR